MNPFEASEAPKLVQELVDRECGPDHNYQTGSLIVRLRYHIRIELGLPV
jgi:hypothetical protein